MKVLFTCHAHPEGDNARGGEKSVRMLIEHFIDQGHEVNAMVRDTAKDHNWDERKGIYSSIHPDRFWRQVHLIVHQYDIVITWGLAAKETAEQCRTFGIPYILMVRWWRNIMNVNKGIGDLMNDPIDEVWRDNHKALFEDAAGVITNNKYATEVIKRYHEVDAKVSYVPVAGKICGSGNPKGTITLITPDKGLGEVNLIARLATAMPKELFRLINCGPSSSSLLHDHANVICQSYTSDMPTVYKETKILLYPVYNNDVCGTSRVGMEACRYGIPVIATDRSGLCELGFNKVSRVAGHTIWQQAINRICKEYDHYAELANSTFGLNHYAKGEMQKYVSMAERIVANK